jgi:hypothetical protein
VRLRESDKFSYPEVNGECQGVAFRGCGGDGRLPRQTRQGIGNRQRIEEFLMRAYQRRGGTIACDKGEQFLLFVLDGGCAGATGKQSRSVAFHDNPYGVPADGEVSVVSTRSMIGEAVCGLGLGLGDGGGGFAAHRSGVNA